MIAKNHVAAGQFGGVSCITFSNSTALAANAAIAKTRYNHNVATYDVWPVAKWQTVSSSTLIGDVNPCTREPGLYVSPSPFSKFSPCRSVINESSQVWSVN